MGNRLQQLSVGILFFIPNVVISTDKMALISPIYGIFKVGNDEYYNIYSNFFPNFFYFFISYFLLVIILTDAEKKHLKVLLLLIIQFITLFFYAHIMFNSNLLNDVTIFSINDVSLFPVGVALATLLTIFQAVKEKTQSRRLKSI